MGAIFVKHVRMKDRVVICHLTLREGRHYTKSHKEYAPQHHEEAEVSSKIRDDKVHFLPFPDIRFCAVEIYWQLYLNQQ